jgi:hypothetical protein
MLKTGKATPVGTFLTYLHFEMGSKFSEVSGIGVSTRANQY